jgi:Ca2+/Na+ antiporter
MDSPFCKVSELILVNAATAATGPALPELILAATMALRCTGAGSVNRIFGSKPLLKQFVKNPKPIFLQKFP